MKILIIGSGGREHAIAWKVSQNPSVEKIYCAPGNGGTALEEKCENINLREIEELLSFALEEKIDLTIVGPEVFLCEGIVDEFKDKGLKIFGPSKEGAKLEGSKSFAKDFMKKYGVKTAAYEVFTEVEKAISYLKECDYPVVIKADGLAAGKGVVIASTLEEAEDTINSFILDDIFEGSGKTVVIEEFLQGVEASILSITDGETIIPFISAKDHKKIFDGEKGPNTGGMGVIAPNPYCSEEVMKEFEENIMKSTLKGIKEEGIDFIGIIFFGLMITSKGVYLLEYNVRMGDPETQGVLPLMESDFVELIERALDKKLKGFNVEWKNLSSCCVTLVSGGYPGEYKKGFPVTLEEREDGGKNFIAGAVFKDGELVTSGGRVVNVTALGKSLGEARERAYSNIHKVHFEGAYFRKDIGEI
ncbi:phosphoribosylamine--glycine ligase [Clostridium malenominatum]|uniref:Phosphoribosylamine--glycine ligase n=1 Tax=Clostridium malenominatum TaxID=1539 RepID=A0ABN1IP71_9CLOT